MKKILGVLSLVVFAISFIIALRQPISIVFLFAVLVIPLKYIDKIGGEIASLLIILGSVFVLFFVNSMVPLWGERYENREELMRISENDRQKRYNNMNVISASNPSVKAELKDPESATFKNQIVGRDGYVCGQVNAKNSFGAYSGFKRYVSKSGMTIIDDGGTEFSKLWGEICS
ncbi:MULTISPECIES: hypothetical protein [Klebsiella pneumoniae complex]|uniref:hypothetical protein n=1 Tax=Klebsiella pneumoniae complex TaxID=3390273 RepID=UPI00101BBCBC|nr:MULTISPECIES: hypothetical protein [Klebsiella]HBX8260339.1 hypothetical protein [Klebsiella pneumoniae]HBZ7604924.1 hypothetical protein [Klebsiella pneumoniae]HCB0645172.1 hypothetical protein [Klebsiella variicola subsp. variicola]